MFHFSFISILFCSFMISRNNSAQLLSRNKPTNQSSLLDNERLSSLANDGSYNQNPYIKVNGRNDCTHTKNESTNYWLVNLEEEYYIYYIVLYNRGDMHIDRLISAKIDIIRSNGRTKTVGQIKENRLQFNISISDHLSGQFVKIILENNYLTLCEVDVYGGKFTLFTFTLHYIKLFVIIILNYYKNFHCTIFH